MKEATRLTILWCTHVPSLRPGNVRTRFLAEYILHELRGVENIHYRHVPFGSPTSRDTHLEIIRLWRLPLLYRVSPKITWHLAARRYDLVVTGHLGSYPSLCSLAISGYLRRRPYVVLAENWYPKRDWWVNRIERLVARRASLVVALSTQAYQFMTLQLGVPAERVVKCVNTLDDIGARPYDQALLSALTRDEGTKILCVARFKDFKGQDLLISAFQEIAGKRDKLYLVGNHETDFGRRCVTLAGNDDRVIFAGHVGPEGIRSHYRASDIFVLPNRFVTDRTEGAESFGYVALEAAWFGLPVVATTATGCADDIVRDGITGRLLPAGNVDALAAALAEYLRKPALAAEHGAAAREQVESLNSRETIRDFEVAFERLLDSLRKRT